MNTDLPLAEQNIVMCKKGTPPLDQAKIAELLELLPEWYVEEDKDLDQPLRITGSGVESTLGIRKLVRKYEFADFAEAVQFSTAIKAMADEANHHPLLYVHGNILTMRWWTHSIKGLHLNDFIMAARSDAFYLGD